MNSVLRLSGSLGLGDNVRYLGYLSSEQYRHVWQRAGALVFPSRYKIGIPTLEAMRFGRPIISSRDGSLPEVVGNAAVFFTGDRPDELAAAMEKIASLPQLRDQLIERGRKRLEAFSLAEEGSKLLAALVAAADTVPVHSGVERRPMA